MLINTHKRKWTPEEKLTLVRLIYIPQRNGAPKAISEIAKAYFVSAKSLYAWKKLYEKLGEEAFDPKPSQMHHAKYNDPELQKEIFHIALTNPELTSKKIIEHINSSKQKITPPTLQKILKLRDLHTIEKRVAASQKAYVNGLKLPESTFELLKKRNPLLKLFPINKTIKGSLFYLKSLKLSDYFKEVQGYVLLAVDTKNLTTFSEVWDGKYLDIPMTFTKNLFEIFGSKNGHTNQLVAEADEIFFIDLTNSKLGKGIKWFDTSEYDLPSDFFEISLKKVFLGIIETFLRNYKFTSVDELKNDLEVFLFNKRISEGPDGYPTFGKSPHHIHHLSLQYFESMEKQAINKVLNS